MHDRGYTVRGNGRSNEPFVPDVAHHERHSDRNRPIEAGREIIQHDDPLASVGELVRHVTSDIAGPAGN